jgi:hypothetical protein
MSWYYASNNEQKGPVEQSELEQLVRQGVITGNTLVWREGMANWRPYSEITAPPVAASPADLPPHGVVCSECGQLFAADQAVRLGNSYVCAACKPVVTQKLREGVAINDGAEQIRKEHINHEASVKSVGVLYFLGATVLLLAGIGLLTASSRPSSAGGGGLMAVLFLGLSGVQIWAGIGLRRLKPWARIPSGILSGLGLLGFPLGTLINGYILYLLFSRKGATVFSDEYKRVIEETPQIKYRTSIVVWIFLAIILALVGLAIVVPLLAHRH